MLYGCNVGVHQLLDQIAESYQDYTYFQCLLGRDISAVASLSLRTM